MIENTNIIIDEIKFFFTFRGKRYMAYVYAISRDKHNMYECIITDEYENNKVIGFRFNSHGDTVVKASDIEQTVLDILFDDNGITGLF